MTTMSSSISVQLGRRAGAAARRGAPRPGGRRRGRRAAGRVRSDGSGHQVTRRRAVVTEVVLEPPEQRGGRRAGAGCVEAVTAGMPWRSASASRTVVSRCSRPQDRSSGCCTRSAGVVVGCGAGRPPAAGRALAATRAAAAGRRLDQEQVQVAAGADRLGQVEEADAAGQDREAEHRQPVGQVERQATLSSRSSSARSCSGGLGTPMPSRTERHSSRLPPLVLDQRHDPAPSTSSPDGPGTDHVGAVHVVAVEQVGDAPGPGVARGAVAARRATSLELRVVGELVSSARTDQTRCSTCQGSVPPSAPASSTARRSESGKLDDDVGRDTVATAGPGAQVTGELQVEPPAHALGRDGDPLGCHRVGRRDRQHLCEVPTSGSIRPAVWIWSTGRA